MLPRDLSGDQIHLRARPVETNAILEPGDDRQVVRIAHDFLRGRKSNRGPKLNLGAWISEARRHDAEDGETLVVKGKGLANDIAAAAETRFPELVVENNHLIAAIGVFLVAEGAA